MRIQVVPSHVRAAAVQIRYALDQLDAIFIAVRRAWEGLDWDIRQEAALELQVMQARRQALALQDEGERLRRFLEERATAFEEADREGVACIAQAFRRWSERISGAIPLSLHRSLLFPERQVQASVRLGNLLGAPSLPIRPTRIFVAPEEQRALLHYGVDLAIAKMGPLGVLKGLLDLSRLPGWQARVEQALRQYEQSLTRYGARSPQAQAAYGNYIEVLLFQMPLVGTAAKALVSLLNILGRARPVQ